MEYSCDEMLLAMIMEELLLHRVTCGNNIRIMADQKTK